LLIFDDKHIPFFLQQILEKLSLDDQVSVKMHVSVRIRDQLGMSTGNRYDVIEMEYGVEDFFECDSGILYHDASHFSMHLLAVIARDHYNLCNARITTHEANAF